MSLNIHLIKKWTKMMLGRSIYHVEQGAGKYYSKEEVKGFYNDLTQKVLKNENLNELPVTITDNGKHIYFPIAIAQFGLGAYDLYLDTNDEQYFHLSKKAADWLFENQEDSGAWNSFGFVTPDYPYSSMAQGEAVSLLLRVYGETGNKSYLECAKKAVDFMLIPIEKGGTTKYLSNDVYLCEYTDPSLSVVLNGWIFSLWGLFDFYKVTKDESIKDVYDRSLTTLANTLGMYDCRFWSYYDLSKNYTSPFYHKLHIAQLDVMYDLTGYDIFNDYKIKWSKYNKSVFNRSRAFILKAIQKLLEKQN